MPESPGFILGPQSGVYFSKFILLLLASLVVAYFPHFFWMPAWVSAIFLFLLGLRGLLVWKSWPLPWKWLRTILVLFIAALIVISFGFTIGRDAGTALLSLMLCFKTFELRTYRDVMVSLFLAYFLALTTVLFSETLLIALSILSALLVLTAVLVSLNSKAEQSNASHPGNQTRTSLHLAFVLFLQALPLALVCFLVFPRLPGAFFGLNTDSKSAVSGLNDSMSPGSISQLALSREVAFRVSFEKDRPSTAKLYWRALVLWDYQGNSWQQGPLQEDKADIPLPVPGAKRFRYTITLEAHNEHYLPALDIPVRAPRDISYLQGNLLHFEEAVEKRKRYELLSASSILARDLNSRTRKIALSLPEQGNRKSKKLAKRLLKQSADSRDMLSNVLDYFQKNSFSYTLNPPLLGKNSLDEFLFQTQKGYCEHYASAFVWLMRAAGIPARVVVGYQGGEYNPLGEYYIIRQSDAHAWAEVWLANKGSKSKPASGGWQRVDPTSVVAPERVQQGAEAVNPGARMPEFWANQQDNWLVSALNESRMAWDALNNSWNQWVLNYTHKQQQELFSSLGLGEDWSRALSRALFIALGLIMFFLVFFLFLLLRRHKPDKDPVVKEYRRFCHRLAKSGLQKKAAEGPGDFALRVAAKRPDLQDEVEKITNMYICLRYKADPKSSSKALRKAVRDFHPSRVKISC